jgi:hypothetical protein
MRIGDPIAVMLCRRRGLVDKDDFVVTHAVVQDLHERDLGWISSLRRNCRNVVMMGKIPEGSQENGSGMSATLRS